MSKAKVKAIVNGIVAGTPVPLTTTNNNIGQWSQDVMTANGHKVSNGTVDYPQYGGLEQKTRKKGSTAHHTVGSMTIQDIISTPWEDSPFCKKLQQQYRIEYDDTYKVVTHSAVYDFSDPVIQKNLKDSYESLRHAVTHGDRSKEIRAEWMVFDGYQHHNSYRCRIPHSKMKTMESMSNMSKQIKSLFQEQ